jgi:uncharacterized membrane-anchored protein YitT (DUF2179 family)
MNKDTAEKIRSYLIVTLGCLLMGFSFNCFYHPIMLSLGGFSGIAQILNHFVPSISIGIFSILLNAPLFIIAWRKLGARFLVKSLYTMIVVSLSFDLWAMIYSFKPLDLILGSVYGGVTLGLGLGMVLREGTSSGGTDLLAVLIRPYIGGLSIGNLGLIIDIVVILIHSSVFRGLDLAMYSGVSLFISYSVVDLVVYGKNTAKLTYIISSKNDEIADRLLKMNMGVTKIEAEGAYTGTSRPVLLCAVRKREMLAVKKLIKEVDDNAFFILCDATEVLGEGFGTHSDNPL